MTDLVTNELSSSAVERAVSLAHPTNPGAVEELAALGAQALEDARMELVRRIHQRSDDYQATAALSLVNKALAALGWEDPYNWKHRRKP